MSLDTMSFVLGGILVAAGLFGGGIELKELKLPQIGTAARVLSATVGAIFIGLAVFLNPKPSVAAQTPAEADPQKTTMTFPAPMHGDLRLDVCLQWGQVCGEPAATAWCKTKGLARALEFPSENIGAQGVGTRLIGTNQVCKEAFCTSFIYIVCEK